MRIDEDKQQEHSIKKQQFNRNEKETGNLKSGEGNKFIAFREKDGLR